jgi:hypothetical protein
MNIIGNSIVTGCAMINPAMNFPPDVRLQLHTNGLLTDIKYRMNQLEKEDLPPEKLFNFEQELKKKILNYHLSVDRMVENGLADQLVKPQMLVRRRLPTIDFLRKMLLEISVVYKKSAGNKKQFINGAKMINPIYPRLINVLVGVNFPIEKMVTFSFWDRFIAQCLIGWCVLHEKQITPMTLYKIIDSINGDTPYKPAPPRNESLRRGRSSTRD